MSTFETTAAAAAATAPASGGAIGRGGDDMALLNALDDSGVDFFDKFLQENGEDALDGLNGVGDSDGNNLRASATLMGDDVDAFLSMGNSSMNGSFMMDFAGGDNTSGHNSTSKFPSNHSSSTPPLGNNGNGNGQSSTENSAMNDVALAMPTDQQNHQQPQHSQQSMGMNKSNGFTTQNINNINNNNNINGSSNNTNSTASMNLDIPNIDDLVGSMNPDNLLETAMGKSSSSTDDFRFGPLHEIMNNGDIMDADVVMGQSTANTTSQSTLQPSRMAQHMKRQQRSDNNSSSTSTSSVPSMMLAAMNQNANKAQSATISPSQRQQFQQHQIQQQQQQQQTSATGNAAFASVFPKSASSLAAQGQNTQMQNMYNSTLGASPLNPMPSFPITNRNSNGIGSGGIAGIGGNGSGNNNTAAGSSSSSSSSMSPFAMYQAKKMQQQQQQSAGFQGNANFANRASVLNNMSSTSKLKSTMSDGMLARALKAKYTGNNNDNGNGNGNGNGNDSMGGPNSHMGNANMSFFNNGNKASIGGVGRMSTPGFNRVTGLPRNAISSVTLSGSSRGPIAASISRSKLRHAANASSGYINAHNSRSRLAAVELSGNGGSGGQQNATWGGSTKRSNSALFSKLLSSKGMKKDPTKMVTTKSSSSISKMIQSRRHSSRNLLATAGGGGGMAGGSSSASINDFLRNSKQLTKTQSLLRQSSQQSLSKRQSFQNLTNPSAPGKVDLSFLLPPSHTKSPNASARKDGALPTPPGDLGATGGGKNGNSAFPSMGLSGSATTSSNKQQGGNGAISMDSSLLHQSCRLYPTTAAVVESAVRIDPSAVSRAISVSASDGKNGNDAVYGYPINIAMNNGATREVVQMLAQAAPDVLIQKDGQEGLCSLAIAIRTKCDPSILEVLYQVNPKCVQVSDRRANTPLHTAVSSGAALPIIKQLYRIYPKALEMRNFNSMTPLDLAQQSTRCSETVMNFLQSSAFSPLENRTAYQFDSSCPPTKAKNFGMMNPNGNNQGLLSMANGGNSAMAAGSLEEGLDDIMEANI